MKLDNCDEIFNENIIYGIFKMNSQNQKLFLVTFWNWVFFYELIVVFEYVLIFRYSKYSACQNSKRVWI